MIFPNVKRTGFNMSTSLDVIKADSPQISVCGVVLDQTEMGSLDSDFGSHISVPKDYWFGRKYFDCVLAQHLLQTSRLYESAAQIDSELERAIKNFPYAQRLKELEAQGLGSLLSMIDTDFERDAYRTMMFCIGIVVRVGDRKQKAALLVVLRQSESQSQSQSRFPLSLQLAGSNDVGNTNERKDSGGTEQSAYGNQQSTMDLGRYVTALKEYGDKHSFVPRYRDTELSKCPSQFRAMLTVKDSTYEGVAKSKKQARHEAARKACADIGIVAR